MNTNEIKANVNDISLDQSATGTNAFCEIWPVAKKALTLLTDIVKNPFLKVAITAIIATGDAISGKICQ